MDSIAITVCATKSYQYALPALLRAIQRNLYQVLKNEDEPLNTHLILVGDADIQCFESEATKLMPDVKVHVHTEDWTEGENYKKHAQLTIAQMRSKAFELARSLNVDNCWSLDSDVLPPDNALLCSMQMLSFDNGYYSIACCPYPSQGGGAFLTGHGTPTNPIMPDFDLEEREVPEEKLKEWDELHERIKKEPEEPSHYREKFELQKQIEKDCPPKYGGNIWKLNAEHGWKRRGWFDFAYPAIGRGAIVPTDWAGFGCTLMSSDALAAADFTGYVGDGTEDLFIIWKRWYPRRLLLCSIPHCPCDHIVRTGESKKLVHTFAYHEEHEATRGHLRREFRPWHQHTVGEVHDPENDGIPDSKQQNKENPTKQKG